MVMVDQETQLPLDESPSENYSDSEASSDRTPESSDAKLCKGCGDPITRGPGVRGRLPDYHPGCRPAGKPKSSGGTGKGSRTKAEQEADFLAEKFRQQLNKTAIVVGVLDPFDGYAIVVQSKPMSENARNVLLHYDRLRKALMNGESSGGVAGLVLSSLFIALPILAHHGIIPAEIAGRPIGQFLEGLPKMLKKFQQKSEEAEKELADQLAGESETSE